MRVEFLDYESDDGSDDCSLIRFYTTERKAFALLHREIGRLASGAAQFYRLHDDIALDMIDDLEVTLLVGENSGVRQMDDRRFIWEATQDQWLLMAGLVEPFARDPHSDSFQWLAGPEARYGLGGGDIAVLLSSSPDGRW